MEVSFVFFYNNENSNENSNWISIVEDFSVYEEEYIRWQYNINKGLNLKEQKLKKFKSIVK